MELFIIILIVLIISIIISISWASGIENMNIYHPEYRGNDLFNDEDNENRLEKNGF